MKSYVSPRFAGTLEVTDGNDRFRGDDFAPKMEALKQRVKTELPDNISIQWEMEKFPCNHNSGTDIIRITKTGPKPETKEFTLTPYAFGHTLEDTVLTCIGSLIFPPLLIPLAWTFLPEKFRQSWKNTRIMNQVFKAAQKLANAK